MELPKNITQIGEADRSCKVYIEDYVISFIKQMNHLAENKDIAVALYGIQKEENGISYLFLYGACKLDYLNKEVRHLSQAQSQEIEKLRKKYFSEYTFLGYRLLNGEMVEGIYVCEQGICRYVKGYACFYEKNDGMLAYMVDSREEEAKPEEVPQEKYEEVKQRQEERKINQKEHGSSAKQGYENKQRHRMQKEKQTNKEQDQQEKRQLVQASSKTLRRMQFSAAGMFALLCVTGLATAAGGEKMEEWKAAAKQWTAGFMEQKIPDSDEMVAVMGNNSQTDKLVAEEKLTEAIRQENKNGTSDLEPIQQGVPVSQESSQPPVSEELSQNVPETEELSQESPVTDTTSEPSQEPSASESISQEPPVSEEPSQPSDSQPAIEELPSQESVPAAAEPVSYEIREGDTLIGICIRTYGSDDKVQEICNLNHISNPDNIRIGQKILLP